MPSATTRTRRSTRSAGGSGSSSRSTTHAARSRARASSSAGASSSSVPASPERRTGRHLQLHAKADDLLSAVRSAVDRYVAAEAFGIGRSTLRAWIEYGGSSEPCHVDVKEAGRCPESTAERRAHADGACPTLAVFRAFRADLERAESEAEANLVARVQLGAQRDWRAAWALLRARWPERYNVATQHVLTDARSPADPSTARERLLAELDAAGDRLTSPIPLRAVDADDEDADTA